MFVMLYRQCQCLMLYRNVNVCYALPSNIVSDGLIMTSTVRCITKLLCYGRALPSMSMFVTDRQCQCLLCSTGQLALPSMSMFVMLYRQCQCLFALPVVSSTVNVNVCYSSTVNVNVCYALPSTVSVYYQTLPSTMTLLYRSMFVMLYRQRQCLLSSTVTVSMFVALPSTSMFVMLYRQRQLPLPSLSTFVRALPSTSMFVRA